jgi:hypothetical protein
MRRSFTRVTCVLGFLTCLVFLRPAAASGFGAYHFGQPGRPHTIEPFVEGGLGISTAGVGPIVEVGGGADWWLTLRVGIRACATEIETALRDVWLRPPDERLGVTAADRSE